MDSTDEPRQQPTPRVLGSQVGQDTGQSTSLPRTGGDMMDLSLLAIGLVLLGTRLTRSSTRTR